MAIDLTCWPPSGELHHAELVLAPAEAALHAAEVERVERGHLGVVEDEAQLRVRADAALVARLGDDGVALLHGPAEEDRGGRRAVRLRRGGRGRVLEQGR